MSKVLIIFEVKDNTTDNNLLSLTTVLSEMKTQYRVVKSSCVNTADIGWCDVVLANRPNSIYSIEIINAAKNAGRFVIVSLDDDIINLPRNHPSYWKRKFTLRSLILGDVLMSTSPLIHSDYCANYHLRPLLVNSFVKQDDLKSQHNLGDKIRIVYPAGKDHVGLFNKYIKPFFDEFTIKYSDKVDVTFIGVEPKVKESKSVHFVKGMSYGNYLDYMNTHDFDIGLAPLDDDPFCARKYFAKYIEYSKFGILGLYSDVKPYTYVVKNGYNGLLVKGDCNKWEKGLVELVENPGRISEYVNNSQIDIKERFSLNHAVQELREGCPELESFHHNTSKVFYKIDYLQVIAYFLFDKYVKIRHHCQHERRKWLIKVIK